MIPSWNRLRRWSPQEIRRRLNEVERKIEGIEIGYYVPNEKALENERIKLEKRIMKVENDKKDD